MFVPFTNQCEVLFFCFQTVAVRPYHTNMSGLETKVNELKLDVAELRALGDRYRVKRTTLMRSNI